MRLLKQFIYGFFFCALIGLVGFGIFRTAYNPAPSCTDGKQNQGERDIDCGGPCAPCGISQAQAIQIASKRAFRAADGSGIVVELHNPNNAWGVRSFDYEISLKDQFGKELYSLKSTSFIYPGEIKYIVEPYVQHPFSSIASVDVVTSNVRWIAADEFSKPAVDVQDYKTFRDRQLFVSGKVINRDQSPVGSLQVKALLFSKDNELVAASRVELSSLDRLASKDFRIAFAKDLSLYEPYVAPSFSLTRTLKPGDSGPDVGNLQQLLREAGLYSQDPTGYYDDVTKWALASFQEKNNLSPTGELDEPTRAYIQKLINDSTPQQNEQQKDTGVDASKTKIFVEALRQ